MSDADYGLSRINANDIRWNGNIGMLDAGDRNLVVQFYRKAHHDIRASREAGRPIHVDMDFITIYTPGEQREQRIDRPVTERDKQRFQRQWFQYSQNKEQTVEGTPVDLLHPDKPSVAQTLRDNGIHTIEQCAEMTAHATDRIMGGQTWKNDAVKYLEIANKGVGAAQFKQEMDQKDSEIRVLGQQVEMLKQQIAQLQKNSANTALSVMQDIVSNATGGRPIMPGSGQVMSPHFDAAQAQIDALDVRNDIAKARRPRERL